MKQNQQDNIDPKTRMEKDREDRKLPPALKKILALDVVLTKRFVSFMLNFVPFRSLRTHCKVLEYSCHGIAWLAGWLAFSWMIDKPDWYQMQVNLFIGLLTDIVMVAVVKAATRRRRPAVNDDPFCIGPDKFSFPSGHVSRGVYIVTFLTWLDPVSIVLWPPLLAWCVSLCLSRLLLYRHHILDVIGGICFGLFNAFLISLIWFDQESCIWIISHMTDEKISGAEYGV
ncbi:polyisoprenoid diphosphate/phosphate phosphohydrolase PLPP6 [Toxorhynchites rutilus septentrionalis]|uniref:polyisoprenoid diphosphate/phosphate phosphohydrolase PLPP6 n=1 Tax=Toxorhynchites rutilus septentrionalis TaxID=329112 RepID=UPI00247AA2AE|nr:polyisoprenoid diphosphate/phosphate phosphohydrolase PLPP6 [Toxorhynchites rutilus septentrionalis]